MFGANGIGFDNTGLFLLLNNLVMMIIAWIPSVTDFEGIKLPKVLKWIICVFVFVLTITFLVSESYNPFLYFRF
jgi:alginate O-acetyltransferase complex protein AlgI